MDALLLITVALMGLAAAMATVLSTFSKAAIFALLAVAPIFYRYRRNIYIIIRTLPRDLKFLWRYINGMRRSKNWNRDDVTVAQLFTERATRCPDAPCFIHNDKIWTFKELAAWSNRCARALQKDCALKKGKAACVMLPTCGEYIGTWLSLAKLGTVAALLNTNLRRSTLLHCVRLADADAIIFDESMAEAIIEIRSELPPNMKYYQIGGKSPAGVQDLLHLMQQETDIYPEVSDPSHYRDTLFYIYTSGTTGLPKAAVLPNAKYLLIVVATVHMLGMRKGDIMYNPLPLYHTAGGLVGTGTALVDGFPVVLRSKFSASNYFTDCQKYNCTIAQYIGEIGRYLVAQPPKSTDTQHNVRIMVGNGMRPAIWQQIVDRYKIPQVNEIYGATEGNANIINVDNTIGAVGFVPSFLPVSLHPMAVIKIDEQGVPIRGKNGFCQRCSPNEPGMFIGLVAEGNASREYHGYINKEESNRKLLLDVFRKGDKAFVSGDLFVMDELGYLYFKDRTGDTYRWKGENVATAEVEGVLSAAMGQRAVAVYGVSVPGMEGRAGMALVSDPTASLDPEAIAIAADRDLPHYARPIFLRITKDDADLTSTFKIKKLTYLREGFDPDEVKDKLYFRPGNKNFEVISRQLYKDICDGKIKF